MICPKCKYERTVHDDGPSDQCPSCGVFYKKVISRIKPITKQPEPPPANLNELLHRKVTWREVRLSLVSVMAVLAYLVYQSSPDPVLPIPTQTQVTQLPPATPPKKIVSNSAWDGSVSQVETYLRRYLKDPDSYQSIEWSPVSELPDGKGFIVRHMYRAKNSFGGYGIDNKIFLLDAQGNVLGAEDIKAK